MRSCLLLALLMPLVFTSLLLAKLTVFPDLGWLWITLPIWGPLVVFAGQLVWAFYGPDLRAPRSMFGPDQQDKP